MTGVITEIGTVTEVIARIDIATEVIERLGTAGDRCYQEDWHRDRSYLVKPIFKTF